MLKKIFQNYLAKADIKIDGNRPWDIKVNDKRFYRRLAMRGIVGLGEAYMDGWWDCDALDQFGYKLVTSGILSKVKYHWAFLFDYVMEKIFNLQQTRRLSFFIGKEHYDLGNELFTYMLDKRMTYSCGYWKDAKNLDEAQEAKLDLICKKIGIKSGMRVLDIGCGWGSFIKYAAEKYKVKAVGITVSKEQVKYIQDTCKDLPIEARLQDYRDLNEKFDSIVSVGMFEHVGYKNYRMFMKVVNRCLEDDGLFLLHTMGGIYAAPTLNQPEARWLVKYIFPRGCLPSLGQITSASDNLFVVEDVQNFGAYYGPTLRAWLDNFDKSWPNLKDKYGKKFYRMWKFFLLSTAGGFRSRKYEIWQIVFSKKGVPGVYQAVR